MYGVSRGVSQEIQMLPCVIIGADAVFVGLVYSNSSPCIEKIQAFEKFFTRHIDFYDKVSAVYNNTDSLSLCDS